MIRPALSLLVFFTAVAGALYPLGITAAAQLTSVDPTLLAHPADDPALFWPRPSAGPSTGSNLGPTNPLLREQVAARVKALRDADPGNDAPVPIELVTASGSGFDPHLSPTAARYQASRVARVSGIDVAAVHALIDQHTEPRTLGVLGEPRINVVKLNRALAAAVPH